MSDMTLVVMLGEVSVDYGPKSQVWAKMVYIEPFGTFNERNSSIHQLISKSSSSFKYNEVSRAFFNYTYRGKAFLCAVLAGYKRQTNLEIKYGVLLFGGTVCPAAKKLPPLEHVNSLVHSLTSPVPLSGKSWRLWSL